MLLDTSARATARNFSTFFLVCMIVLLPLEMAYSLLHKDVIEAREMHSYIEELPRGQKVRGVGRRELADARRSRLIVTGIELALVPLLMSATRRVLDSDREARLPTAADAYRHGLAPFRPGPLPAGGAWGSVLVAALFALAVGFTGYQTGRIVAEAFPDRSAFGILGVVEAAARSIALPWFLVTWAVAGRREPARGSTAEGG